MYVRLGDSNEEQGKATTSTEKTPTNLGLGQLGEFSFFFVHEQALYCILRYDTRHKVYWLQFSLILLFSNGLNYHFSRDFKVVSNTCTISLEFFILVDF